MQKLQLAEKTSWTDEELKNALPNYFEENNFNILNPLWKKDVSGLLYTFRDTLRTADKELTMAMLTTMLRKVLIASFLPSDASLRALSAIKPSQATTAKKIGNDRERLKKLYDALVTLDTDEKQGESTGKIDAFLMALLSYCAAPETL
jgi:DNA polymerase III delta subunit